MEFGIARREGGFLEIQHTVFDQNKNDVLYIKIF